MIYYTSDLHLGHTNIIKLCNRPFSDCQQMDKTLIMNWNSIVTAQDDVYIVGDMAYRGAKETAIHNIRSLKGRKHLIIGNHDREFLKSPEYRQLFVSVDDYLNIVDRGRHVVLFHYPILEWEGYYRGSYHVFGHIHNGSAPIAAILRTVPNAFNAGVDLNEFTPQTLDMLIQHKQMGIY